MNDAGEGGWQRRNLRQSLALVRLELRKKAAAPCFARLEQLRPNAGAEKRRGQIIFPMNGGKCAARTHATARAELKCLWLLHREAPRHPQNVTWSSNQRPSEWIIPWSTNATNTIEKDMWNSNDTMGG